MWTVYGIKNCDTVRKARKWMDGEGIAYTFVDLRGDGVKRQDVARWVDALGWEMVLNRRATTWRRLDEAQKTNLDSAKAVALMVEHPTLVKRPVFDDGQRILAGFGASQRDALVRGGA